MLYRLLIFSIAFGSVLLAAVWPVPAMQDNSERTAGSNHTSRSFQFSYGGTFADLPAGKTIRVWLPVAQSNRQQSVRVAQTKLPSPLRTNPDSYGNKIGYFEFKGPKSGMADFKIVYDVVRQPGRIYQEDVTLPASQREPFLKPNSMVPVDGKPAELIKDRKLATNAFDKGRELYDVVERYMAYDKTKPGYGHGDSNWACDSRTGNCTDFHSLFISLARNQRLPARFEIGFPLPADQSAGTVGGYHCWAWFYAETKGWVPVDISEADKHPEMREYYFGNLTPDRIHFTTGRDIELNPRSASKPLNFFVYPHVEVDGQVWSRDKIKLDFSFENTVPANQ